ncbi:tRNA lysidine(34) synthetase TilS [Gimesia maris]|uniref:tRNA lysidine(34) synthetase TilS n=1 Tax=Gimesia maris TaxID=122 RepID=UPI00241D8ECC|nr:tRNA lysidine(34) synthetase TilS [Gimesia maris]|tara:strand:- start:53626 stop:54690 length:1065 start_codon:yes stop_codon:yes gene_type:complete
MNQFIQTVKRGLLTCQQRIQDESNPGPNISSHQKSPAQRTLIAVSGGADSMALLRALQCLAQSSESLIPPDGLVIAHLNHGLRGTASDEDAEWLKQECRRLSLPCVTEKQELNQGPDSGLEEQCRTARYDFLTRVAIAEQCTQIAVAHTLDDQAETVLHHIIRGTGITGLRGIPQTRVLQQGLHLIRPLLQISREEVVEFLNVCGQEYRNDESNADTSFTRNRIRHQLLPLLKKEFNPNVVQSIQRLSQQAVEVTCVLNAEVDQILKAATLDQNQETWRLDCLVLQDSPDYLVRQCFLKIWQEMNWSRRRMGFDHWQRLQELTLSGQKLSLPDQVEAERRDKLLILRKRIDSHQ